MERRAAHGLGLSSVSIGSTRMRFWNSGIDHQFGQFLERLIANQAIGVVGTKVQLVALVANAGPYFLAAVLHEQVGIGKANRPIVPGCLVGLLAGFEHEHYLGVG